MRYHNVVNNKLTYVKVYDHIYDHFKSEKIAILIENLEYWFAKQKFHNGFFKFLEPCPHRLYKQGDSWAETLGWKRNLFKKIFDAIGIRYSSKTAYKEALESGNLFQGKLYACYYDRQHNQTYFIRNHEYATSFFQTLQKKYVDHISQHSKKHIKVTTQKTKKEIKPVFLEQSRIDDFEQSLIDTKENTYNLSSFETETKMEKTKEVETSEQEEKLNEEYFKKGKNLTKKRTLGTKRSFPLNQRALNTENPQEILLADVLKVWESTVGPVQGWLKAKNSLLKLKQAFEKFFDGCLEKWKAYCRKIASSKFLMGEGASGFKIWLQWAIKPETIARIGDNGFTFGDRELPIDCVLQEQKTRAQAALQARYESIRLEEEEGYLQQYMAHYSLINPALVMAVKERGLADSFLRSSFKTFVLGLWQGDLKTV